MNLQNTPLWSIIAQAVAAIALVVLLVLWLYSRRKAWDTASTIKQVLVWYALSAPWLLVRTPVMYLFLYLLEVPLWAAIVLGFMVERPLFYLTAREIARKLDKQKKVDDERHDDSGSSGSTGG